MNPAFEAFRLDPNGPGLYVPEPESRARQVWTRDDWKILNRAQKLLQESGVSMILKCDCPSCATAPIEKIMTPDGFILRCGHADRVFTKAF